jgi:Fur family zinc uptake transcriptional regulator
MRQTANFHSRSHNHFECINAALTSASSLCIKQGLRFTSIRKRVLELIWASHAPMAAYDLLKVLRLEKDNAEAPTIYRALDFLQTHGMVHKIQSLNAYVGCNHAGKLHASQFLICHQCKQVVEQDNSDVRQAIDNQAADINFSLQTQTVEIMGLCSTCQA